jgi:hypothetical protein
MTILTSTELPSTSIWLTIRTHHYESISHIAQTPRMTSTSIHQNCGGEGDRLRQGETCGRSIKSRSVHQERCIGSAILLPEHRPSQLSATYMPMPPQKDHQACRSGLFQLTQVHFICILTYQ